MKWKYLYKIRDVSNSLCDRHIVLVVNDTALGKFDYLFHRQSDYLKNKEKKTEKKHRLKYEHIKWSNANRNDEVNFFLS